MLHDVEERKRERYKGNVICLQTLISISLLFLFFLFKKIAS